MSFPNLPVGPYGLKASLQGFNTYLQDGIVLQVNTNPTIDIAMAVGSLSEQVTVPPTPPPSKPGRPAWGRSSTTSR